MNNYAFAGLIWKYIGKSYLGVIHKVRSLREVGTVSAEKRTLPIKMSYFPIQRVNRGGEGLKIEDFERTYLMDDPLPPAKMM